MKMKHIVALAIMAGVSQGVRGQAGLPANQTQSRPAAVMKSKPVDERLRNLVIQHDLNGNGQIDIAERKDYVRALARLRKIQIREQAQEVFKRADTNRDGRIDRQESKAYEEKLVMARSTERIQNRPLEKAADSPGVQP